MELKKNEIEFLKQIDEAQQLGTPITFYEHDHEKLREYREKYAEAFRSLSDNLLIDGNINYFCYLVLTPVGAKVLEKIKKEDSNAKDNKQGQSDKRYKMWSLIIGIATLIAAIIGYMLFN
jgi:hypothetical protein